MEFEDLRDAPEIKAEISRINRRIQKMSDFSFHIAITKEETALKYEPLLREKWGKFNEAVELLKESYDAASAMNPAYDIEVDTRVKDTFGRVDDFLKGLE